jgi:hypothetical protein
MGAKPHLGQRLHIAGLHVGAPKRGPMPSALLTSSPLTRARPWRSFAARRPREVSLVRASLRALAAGRLGCASCRRTPLIGETVLVDGERVLCALCRPLGGTGEEAVVHSPESGHTVRRR